MASTFVESKLVRLVVDISPPVARILLRNPALNVIDIPMMEELGGVLTEIESRADVSVVVVSSEGKAFSAGVDVAAHTPDKVEGMVAKFHGVIRALVAMKKVTVAAVHGHCLGGGAELAMVCDVVYTTDSAQWGFPEIKLGCYPPVACTALTGRTSSGGEAAEIGLANRSGPEAELAGAVEECVERLRELSPAALAITKKAIYAWDSMHFDKGLARAEKTYFEELMKTADAQEGIRAFMEKRPAKWTGK